MGRTTRNNLSSGGKLPTGGGGGLQQNGERSMLIHTIGKEVHMNGDVQSSSEEPEKPKSFDFSKEVDFEYTPRQNGFGTVLEFMKRGNDGVKEKMLNECNFIVECRVCNNLFRSPRDFVSHKDKYCTEKYQRVSPGGLAELLRLAQNSFKVNTETVLQNSRISVVLPDVDVCDKSNSCCSSSEGDLSFDVNNLIPMINVALNQKQNIQKPPQNLKPKELELLTNTTVSSERVDGIERTTRQLVPDQNGFINIKGKYKSMHEENATLLGVDGKCAFVGKPSNIQTIVDKLAAQWEIRRSEEDSRKSSLKCVICHMLCPSEKALRIHSRQDHQHVKSEKAEKRKPVQHLNGITKEMKVILVDEYKNFGIKSEVIPTTTTSSPSSSFGSPRQMNNHLHQKGSSSPSSSHVIFSNDSILPTKVPKTKERSKTKLAIKPRVASFRRLTNNSFSATLGTNCETPTIPSLDEEEEPEETPPSISPSKKIKKTKNQLKTPLVEDEELNYKSLFGNTKRTKKKQKLKKVMKNKNQTPWWPLPSSSSNISSPKKIVCLKCGLVFTSEMDMSVHVVTCSTQNNATVISILDRHDYMKTQESTNNSSNTNKSFNNNENEIINEGEGSVLLSNNNNCDYEGSPPHAESVVENITRVE